MDSASSPVVNVRQVSKHYAQQAALTEVSFSIMPGECFALLGPNGAGKTTLLRMLTNIMKPDTGSISVLGSTDIGSVKDRIGYLPEERGLYRHQKIGETLEYFGRLKGLSPSHAHARRLKVLAAVGMSQYAKSHPDTLSKGMAQRIQFAAALIHDPEFVIFDEPFSGLDPVSAQAMQELLLAEKARGRTFLLSTHQMNPVEHLCDRILMLRGGKRVLYGTLPEIQARFQTGVIRVEHIGPIPPLEGVMIELMDDNVTRLRLDKNISLNAILKQLVNSPINMRGFTVEKPTLEDIFIRVAGTDEGVLTQ